MEWSAGLERLWKLTRIVMAAISVFAFARVISPTSTLHTVPAHTVARPASKQPAL